MTGLLLAPIGIGAGLIAGQMSKKLFDFLWSRVSDEEAPRPDQHQIGWPALVGALVIEGRSSGWPRASPTARAAAPQTVATG